MARASLKPVTFLYGCLPPSTSHSNHFLREGKKVQVRLKGIAPIAHAVTGVVVVNHGLLASHGK